MFASLSLNPVWALLAALLLSCAWLAPNHSFPWTTFHGELVLAAVAWIGGVAAWWYAAQRPRLYFLNVLTLVLMVVPVLQFALGLVTFSGHAAVLGLYIAGFYCAQVVAQLAEQRWPHRAAGVLMGAMGIAAGVSVGLQLYQWMGLTRGDAVTDIWVLGGGGDRPFANLGQANQLATLFLWGLLALAFAVWQGAVGRARAGKVVIALASAWLVLGLALTQSRTGLLGLLVMLGVAVLWKPLRNVKSLRWLAAGLVLWYGFLLWAIPQISVALYLDEAASILTRPTGTLRVQAWQMFADAIAQRPWWGYGMNQGLAAQVEVIQRHPLIEGLWSYAHNEFLDLVVWNGIPAGLLMLSVTLAWFVIAMRRVRQVPDAIYLLLITVLGIHAMLEYPLAYTFFLLPLGAFIGILNARLAIWPLPARWWPAGFAATVVIYGGTVALLSAVAYDYFRLEQSYTDIRFQNAQIKMSKPASVPQALVLNQMQAQLSYFLYLPRPDETSAQIDTYRALTNLAPGYHNILKLVSVLALNGYPEEAAQWMRKAPLLLSASERAGLEPYWANQQLLFPVLKSQPWVKD